MYNAVAQTRDVTRQAAALALILDPALDIRETIDMIWAGSEDANSAVARQFFKDHKAEILARLPQAGATNPIAGYAYLFTGTCQAAQRDEVTSYVRKEFSQLPGGVRVVDQAIEGMNQCIATRAVVEPELRGWLTGVKIPKAGKTGDKPEAKPNAKPSGKGKGGPAKKGRKPRKP